jgi:hypothetical protein
MAKKEEHNIDMSSLNTSSHLRNTRKVKKGVCIKSGKLKLQRVNRRRVRWEKCDYKTL